MAAHGTCSVTEGLLRRRCERASIATCVYCGRPFCDGHGERAPDHEDTCSRRPCRIKRADVRRHVEWKRRNHGANRMSICAWEECESRMEHQCVRCRMMFCNEHVRKRQRATAPRRDQPPVSGLICDHCAGRRKIWG